MVSSIRLKIFIFYMLQWQWLCLLHVAGWIDDFFCLEKMILEYLNLPWSSQTQMNKVEWKIPFLLKIPHFWSSSFFLASIFIQCFSPVYSSCEASLISVLPLYFQYRIGLKYSHTWFSSLTHRPLKQWCNLHASSWEFSKMNWAHETPQCGFSFIHSPNIYWMSTMCQVLCLVWE